ncbi:MAG: hypothetical protein FWD46_08450 [Cystobacterineae bacterium]|nr:hypothetical protein [Cystobacterineae bacterium]
MSIRHGFYIWGIVLLFAHEAGASERLDAFSRLSLSHMHYLKSCFAFERGDIAKARDELFLAQILDEGSPHLRLAKQRQKAPSSSSQGQLQGELSGVKAEGEHSQVGQVSP